MTINSAPPEGRDTEEWLEWLSGQPYLTGAIDAAKEKDMDFQIVAYAVGAWIRDHHREELAERIAAEFARLESVLP